MSEIQDLISKIKEFCEERDWVKFQNHKDIAISLTLEAAEVLEHFQWKTPEEIDEYVKTHKDEIGEEIADVAYYLLELCDKLDLDFVEIFDKKMVKNRLKYPVDQVKGK